MNSTVTKNGIYYKCQQNSSVKVRRVYRGPKYIHSHIHEKKEITQCDTQACLRSNNTETNSFFAPLSNPIKFCD